jgi:hypothetical protein
MDTIVTATLVLQVTIKLNDEHPDAVRSHLNDIVEHASNRGLITGETSMEVDDIRWHVLVSDEYANVEGII